MLWVVCVFQDKVPNIALLGSGGGQRAMVALLESLVQLDKAGLLDCILYLSGVSGSTWYEPWETTNTDRLNSVECQKWEQFVLSLKVHGLLIPRTRLVHQTRDRERQNHRETRRSRSELDRQIDQTEELLHERQFSAWLTSGQCYLSHHMWKRSVTIHSTTHLDLLRVEVVMLRFKVHVFLGRPIVDL